MDIRGFYKLQEVDPSAQIDGIPRSPNEHIRFVTVATPDADQYLGEIAAAGLVEPNPDEQRSRILRTGPSFKVKVILKPQIGPHKISLEDVNCDVPHPHLG